MQQIDSTAIIYSRHKKAFLVEKCKQIFSKFNTYVIFTENINDIILKRFYEIDYLVLDLTQEELDFKSIELLKSLEDCGYIKEIVCVLNDKDSNVEYFKNVVYDDSFLKNFENLYNSYMYLGEKVSKVCESQWYKIIADYLSSLGFSAKKNGYLVLIDVFIYYLTNNCVVKNLTKTLYPFLANKYKTSLNTIELQIRLSIEQAFRSKKMESFASCPTIKEFINYSLTQIYNRVYSKRVINTFRI